MITEIAAALSTIMAFATLIVTLIYWRQEKRAARLVRHYELVSGAEDMLSGQASFLRFHSLEPSTIQQRYGLSPADLSYLLHSFNAGSLSYLLSGSKEKGPFPKGSYRYTMLESEATQRAFPLLKQFFDSENPYIARCERTIRLLESENAVTPEKNAA